MGGLLARLQQQFGRLDFTPADLVGKSARSGAFKTMFILFAGHHARDWKTSLVISPKHQNKADKIEFHHIFPKDYLKTNQPGCPTPRSTTSPISRSSIRDEQASQCKGTRRVPRRVYADEDFAAQLIDFDAGRPGCDYERFIAERRAEIAAALNEFFGLRRMSDDEVQMIAHWPTVLDDGNYAELAILTDESGSGVAMALARGDEPGARPPGYIYDAIGRCCRRSHRAHCGNARAGADRWRARARRS